VRLVLDTNAAVSGLLWPDRARLWARRTTDIVAGGQPPLNDKFQATFQMTLFGNAVLSRLWESHRYRILPFPGGRGSGEVIEVYPGATLRQMGLANYKSRPDEAIRRAIAVCAAVIGDSGGATAGARVS
jgi:hypothetical protein